MKYLAGFLILMVFLGQGCIGQSTNNNDLSREEFNRKAECGSYVDSWKEQLEEQSGDGFSFSFGEVCYSRAYNTCVGTWTNTNSFDDDEIVGARDLLTGKDIFLELTNDNKTWLDLYNERQKSLDCIE